MIEKIKAWYNLNRDKIITTTATAVGIAIGFGIAYAITRDPYDEPYQETDTDVVEVEETLPIIEMG